MPLWEGFPTENHCHVCAVAENRGLITAGNEHKKNHTIKFRMKDVEKNCASICKIRILTIIITDNKLFMLIFQEAWPIDVFRDPERVWIR